MPSKATVKTTTIVSSVTSRAKSSGNSSQQSKGNSNRCPSCGKFTSKKG